jgi:hypothetical protein
VVACPESNAYRDYNYGYDLMGNRTLNELFIDGEPAYYREYHYNPSATLRAG